MLILRVALHVACSAVRFSADLAFDEFGDYRRGDCKYAPDRLLDGWLEFVTSRHDCPFYDSLTATAVFGALIALAGLGIWTHRDHLLGHWLTLLAVALAIYVLSVSTVDLFQGLVDPASLDSRVRTYQRQAQVALSILWSVAGGLSFIGGIVLRSAALRLAGLALLGLATTKVFLYDLSSLDAAYRVVSFIGLGLLLLTSSWVYQRFTPHASHSSP